MEYALIGEHLKHSFSKEIHQEFADYRYELCEVAPEDLAPFITRRAYRGLNVTIPYKKSVIPLLDAIDKSAESIGAVNTIVNRDDILTGYNTDFFGLSSLIEYNNISIKGEKVLILGTGGTSATATAVVNAMGAAEVYRISRNKGQGVITYDEMYQLHLDAGVIINTTPVGMFPNTMKSPIDIRRFIHCHGVVDAIYNPLRSELVLSALACGIKATGGLYMLVAQAAKAASLFLNDDRVLDKIETVYQSILRSKENVVLIGMPGCGKTTVGTLLQNILNRAMYDSDDEVVATAGLDIPTIFKTFGEERFRSLESEIIHSLADKTGCIIATGGGAVLREDNVRALRKNGRLVLLNRPLDALMPTDDRPLASNREMLTARYRERMPLYESIADDIIDGSTAEDTAKMIAGVWLK